MKSNELVIENNKQIAINTKLDKRINKIIAIGNEKQKQINRQIISAKDGRSDSHKFNAVEQILKIHFQLDQIRNHLEVIFQTIQLARLHTIFKDFLEPEEISFITQKLTAQNVTFHSLDQAYKYLDVQAFYTRCLVRDFIH